MAINLLTDRKIQSSKPREKEYLLSDGGGLHLRVRANGSKDWLFLYTIDGKRKKIGLGPLTRTTLATARDLATQHRDTLARDIDPQAAIQARKEQDRQERAAAESRITIRQLFERWQKLELVKRRDQGAEVQRCFKKDVLPSIGDMIAGEVKRPVITAMLDKIVERGAPIIARNLLGDLRQMFGFGIKRGHVENDPTSHLKRDDFGRKLERDRVLSLAEIRVLSEKLPKAEMWDSSISAIWIMLATCCRVGEITAARGEHLDLEAGTWTIPAEHAKNAKEHVVFLSDFARRHFLELKTRAERLESEWLCPAKNKRDTHVCPKSLAKQIGDRQRPDAKPMKGRSPNTSALVLLNGKWTPHDLRRTGSTLMGELGVRPEVIEKCLNHVQQNRLMRIYQRQELLEPRREAWQRLGEHLESLTAPQTA
jgi:integrase